MDILKCQLCSQSHSCTALYEVLMVTSVSKSKGTFCTAVNFHHFCTSAFAKMFSISVHRAVLILLLSISGIIHMSPMSEEERYIEWNRHVCGYNKEWWRCQEFLEKHLHNDTIEYGQLQFMKDEYSLFNPEIIAYEGFTELIQVLLRHGAHADTRWDKQGRTMLHGAARGGRDDIIKLLLTLGANIEKQTWLGDTPLLVATKSCNPTSVSLLLDSGADINAADSIGRTSLSLSVCPFHLLWNNETKFNNMNEIPQIRANITKLLLDRGADVNKANIVNMTPLHIAAANRDLNLTIVKLLVEKGSDIHSINSGNETILFTASVHCNVPVVEYLLTMGVDKTITNIIGNTPLYIAKLLNCKEVIDLLSRKN